MFNTFIRSFETVVMKGNNPVVKGFILQSCKFVTFLLNILIDYEGNTCLIKRKKGQIVFHNRPFSQQGKQKSPLHFALIYLTQVSYYTKSIRKRFHTD